MAATISDTKTTSNIDHGPINLRQHSLNAVVGHNKLLWQRPRNWTQAHLQALCVDRQSSAVVDKTDRENRPRVIIPKLDSDTLGRFITTIAEKSDPPTRAGALIALLVFDLGNIISGGLEPRFEFKEDLLSFNSDSFVHLSVKRRSYQLPLKWMFVIGCLLIPYVDSAQIDSPPFCAVGHASNQFYEPFITAVLIAIAQEGDFSIDSSSTDESAVIKTQLIFTHRNDTQAIHVYKACVSQSLLERFKHPNKPPTTCSASSLIKLRHIRVPYEPQKCFRRRILNELSLTCTIMGEDECFICPKRKHSPVSDLTDPKRQRQESPQRESPQREGSPTFLQALDLDYSHT
ncbi:hypothetical protein F4680DRAFT_468291 [Xylaria scruposa]|nr:hypothetical protein F4680DRAFT_468291 [Xylaria scruposa]